MRLLSGYLVRAGRWALDRSRASLSAPTSRFHIRIRAAYHLPAKEPSAGRCRASRTLFRALQAVRRDKLPQYRLRWPVHVPQAIGLKPLLDGRYNGGGVSMVRDDIAFIQSINASLERMWLAQDTAHKLGHGRQIGRRRKRAQDIGVREVQPPAAQTW